jgi:hypothetical protein
VEVEEIAPGDATPIEQGTHTSRQHALPAGLPLGRAAVLAPEGSQRAELEQLRELEAKIEEDCRQLVHLRATLEQERSDRGDDGLARHRARDAYCRINNDEGGEQPPPFARASQNVAATAILLRTMPAPSIVKGRQVRDELRGLLECATVQQAKSSASQRREPEAEPSAAPSR